jgi:hypothetical protein
VTRGGRVGIEQITGDYLTAPQIARASGVDTKTVHNWLKYHRYMDFIYIVPGKPVVKREDFEKFKSEHPELIRQPKPKVVAKAVA